MSSNLHIDGDFTLNLPNYEAEFTENEQPDIQADFYINMFKWGDIQGDIADQTDLIDLIDTKIEIEATARENNDLALQNGINTLNNDLTAEISNRGTADGILQDNIDTLSDTVTNNYNALDSAITSEATTRANADTTLQSNIDTLSSTVTSNYNTLNGAITSEQTERENADNTLQDNIDTLSGTVTSNYNTLDGKIGDNKTSIDNHVADKTNPHEVTKAQVGLGNCDNTSDLNKPISTATQTALDGKVPTSRTVNGKALTSDITLTASDVDALPDTTTINDLTTAEQQSALNSGATSTNIGQIATNTQNISNEVTNRQNADNALQSQIDALVVASDVFDIVGTYAELQAYDISTVPVNDIIKVLVDSTHNNAATYYRCVENDNVKSWSYIGAEGAYYTKSEADNRFVEQTTTINGQALSNNITLDAEDVGALPDSTTIGNGTLTIQKNGSTIDSFGANDTGNTTVNITVPTDTSDLTNNAGYIKGINSTDVTNALGYTPYDSSNPDGYTDNVGTVTSVNNTQPDANGNVTLSIPAAQVNSDWNASSGVAQILNKPTIPTKTSDLTNDSNFIPNTATGNNSLTIQGTATSQSSSINIGVGSSATDSFCTVIGRSATATKDNTVAVGYNAKANDTLATALGGSAEANGLISTAIGSNAKATGNLAIQIGSGTNSTNQSMAVGFGTDKEYQLLDGTTGLIPDARISSNIARTSAIPTVGDGTITINQGGVQKGTFTTNQSGNTTIDLDAGGGSSTDVQINGTSIVSNDVANIVTNTAYNSSSNKIATMSDLPTVPTDISAFNNDSGYIKGINSTDVTTALGYTPYDSTNPDGYTDNVGTVTSVNNTQPDANGNVTISIPIQVQANWNETDTSSKAYIQNKPSLSTVATTGDYDDLTNKPTIPAAQVQSNWNETDTSSKAYIENKPTLSTVATTGDYDDLLNKPTLFSGDYNDLTNKPSLSTVATTGDYDDLLNKPTIPTVGDGTITITQGGTTKGTFTTNQSGNTTIDLDAGGGSSTDVQINGTSVTSGGVADIITEGVYDAEENKIATMSDLAGKQDVLTAGNSIAITTGTVDTRDTAIVTTVGNKNWQETAYVNNKFVAVGNDGYICVSDDGETWGTPYTVGSTTWRGIAYGNGMYVICGNSGKIAYSSDFVNWTTLTIGSSQWNDVTYQNNKFIAVRADGYIGVSDDGVNWTTTSIVNGNVLCVTYGNGLYVVGGFRKVYTSTDLTNWTEYSLSGGAYYQCVTYAFGRYIAMSDTGYIATSTDGVNWTTTRINSDNWQEICFNGNCIVAVGNSGYTTTSTDGIVWTTPVQVGTNNWYGLAYNNSQFVAVGVSGSTTYFEVVSSDDVYISVVADSDLSNTSTNPVQNKRIYSALVTLNLNISSKVPKTTTVNGKALTSNITLETSDIANCENTTNKVTAISSSSTDSEYPTAKCMYDIIGDVETLINAL